ncbi:hypothetical protein JW911_01150 [Candidatus Peregrinibacteria bacterium]|nr:hypothetical protein [Candidatus Peregrinibacteria bacterium]
MIKKQIQIIITAILICSFNISPALAAEINQQNVVNTVICERDWLGYISTTLSYADFTETWKDIFVRYNFNKCYFADIQNVLKQMDNTGGQLRKAFYACSPNSESLSKKYRELEVELMFLRNFIDFDKGKATKISEEKILQKLRNEYVLDSFIYTDDELKALFDKFKKKYGDKYSKVYLECIDPGLAQLSKKWDQIVKTVKELGTQTEKLAEDWNKTINTPVKRTEPFLQNTLNTRLNNLPALLSPDQVLTKFKTTYGGIDPTISEFQQSVTLTQEEYAKKTTQAVITAQYESLYKDVGDSMAIEMENKLKELNTTIRETYLPIENLTQCTKTTDERQCK